MVSPAAVGSEKRGRGDHLRRRWRGAELGAGQAQYSFGGWLLQRDFGRKWTLGGEGFAQSGRRSGASTRSSTLIDPVHMITSASPKFQASFMGGHSVAVAARNDSSRRPHRTWGAEKGGSQQGLPQSARTLVSLGEPSTIVVRSSSRRAASAPSHRAVLFSGSFDRARVCGNGETRK